MQIEELKHNSYKSDPLLPNTHKCNIKSENVDCVCQSLFFFIQ